MRISLIVAMARNGLIGDDKGLPWRLPADLRRFRKLTSGKPIILGRKTLEHIGGPLKDRLNIVLTRQVDFQHAGCVMAYSFEEALVIAWAALPEMGADEIMVIGGADVYRQALPFVERIYLTVVEGEFSGNTYFPADEPFCGRIVHNEAAPADEKNAWGHRFSIVERDDNGTSIMTLIQQLSSLDRD
jgi:dihydrofolate reductase